MRRLVLCALACLAALPPVFAEPPEGPASRVGILVVAHGGTNRWDAAVRKAVKQAKLKMPVEVALGMGMHPHEAKGFQVAADRLERKGVERIVVVPLLVSSHSDVYRQFEYVFGARTEAAWPEVKPLRLEVPVVMGGALDADPVLVDILLERAKALSRQPEKETVILLAHGPNDDADNERWLADMRQLEGAIKTGGGFHEVKSLTLRDDAPKAVQERATQQLRQAVQRAGEQGRALVVPLLIAPGGIERKIPERLAGLSYQFSGQTLLPHPKLAGWIARQARQLIAGEAPATAPSPVAEPSPL